MKIAVLSDTHNNITGTQDALARIAAEGVDTIIHCGDMTQFVTAECFKDFCVHHVSGNGDFDMLSIGLALQECKPGSTSSMIYTDYIDGKFIAALHGHQLSTFSTLVESGKYDYIFHGHTHVKEDRMITAKTRVICPGAIGGAHRGKRGFCIIDLATGELTDFDSE